MQGDKRHEVETPTLEVLKRELEQGREQADSVVFTGGEPSMRRDLLQLVSLARDLGYGPIQIQSNGRTFASLPYCEQLIGAGATEFSPALHGPTAALHDWLTRAPGSFAQTVTGIRNLRSMGQHVLTNSVVVRANFRNLVPLARLLVHLDVAQFQFAFVHPVGSVADAFTATVPRMALVAPHLMAALQVGRDGGRPVFTEAVPYCILPGYEECVVETRIPRTRVVDAGVTVEDYRAYRLDQGKLKGPRCPGCVWFAECEGPWREYPETYGFDELEPVPEDAA